MSWSGAAWCEGHALVAAVAQPDRPVRNAGSSRQPGQLAGAIASRVKPRPRRRGIVELTKPRVRPVRSSQIEQRRHACRRRRSAVAFDQLAATMSRVPAGRRRAQASSSPTAVRLRRQRSRRAVHDGRRGQDLIAASNAPVKSQALSEPAPQPQRVQRVKRAVQRGEGDAGQKAGMRHCMPPRSASKSGPARSTCSGRLVASETAVADTQCRVGFPTVRVFPVPDLHRFVSC